MFNIAYTLPVFSLFKYSWGECHKPAFEVNLGSCLEYELQQPYGTRTYYVCIPDINDTANAESLPLN